jgi:antitoxin MazE
MNARISRREGGLAVELPQEIAARLGLREGDRVTLHVESDAILLRKEEPTLEDLIARVTDENRHDATEWGPPVGHEVW